MTTILFKYKDNNLTAIVSNDEKQHIINGQNIDYLLKMIANDEIKKIEIKNNHVLVYYSKDQVIIEDFKSFLSDQKNFIYINSISKYQMIQKEINKLKAKEILAKKKRNSASSYKKEKIIHFIRRTSITGIALTSLIAAATLPVSYSFIEKINNSNIENDMYVPPTNEIAEKLDNEKIISINFTGSINNKSNLYVKENYIESIEKYAKRYGVDSEIVKAILANNIDTNSLYIDENYGAIKNEYESYIDNSIVAYNYEKNEYELYPINKETLIDKDKYIKTTCMLLESKLRLCNYNIVAAIQCMNEDENDFKEKIISYGKWKYSDDDTIPKTNENYFKLVVDDLNDLRWLDIFANDDGKIYAINVLEHISEGASIKVKQTNNEITNFKIKHNYTNLELN